MAEFQGFDFAKVTLDAFNKSRSFAEQQRQYNMEQARQTRQDNLLNMLRSKEYDLSAMNAQTSRMNAENNQAETRMRIAENFDIYNNDAQSIPKNAIPGESILSELKGKFLAKKEKVNLAGSDLYEDIVPSTDGTGEYQGKTVSLKRNKITGDLVQFPIKEKTSPIEESIQALTLMEKQRREQDASNTANTLLEKKQAIYNSVMNFDRRAQYDEKTKEEIPGTGYYFDKATLRKFKNEEDLRTYAIQEAEKSGIVGKINKWGRINKNGVATTYNQSEYEKIKGISNNKSNKPEGKSLTLSQAKILYKSDFDEALKNGWTEEDAFQKIKEYYGIK